MNILSINAFHIIFAAVAVIALYISAIMLLYRSKSGLLPYLAVFFFPVVGPLGIILGNFSK
ncbi:hypothetical protein [uncultured Chryseobacterium sp.]|nr:hypothetical protein [uncultured Chryseobacterium sp.]